LVILAAGAIGNLIDRIAHTYVVDFIYFRLINFPIFNFADICVTLSAIFLIIFLVFIYKDDPEFTIFSKKKDNG
ncbi:MAG: signal peptidase II, partial [Lachnospiraceae bacterium]|nr:signal peptidase II [Lachnospiraceae bacterium]